MQGSLGAAQAQHVIILFVLLCTAVTLLVCTAVDVYMVDGSNGW